jgi:hypothetical protein
MKVTGYASDKDCRSPADNDKDHLKSELLFARQPDLAAVHTSLPFPLTLSTETARRSFESLIFFRKRCRRKLPRSSGVAVSSGIKNVKRCERGPAGFDRSSPPRDWRQMFVSYFILL